MNPMNSARRAALVRTATIIPRSESHTQLVLSERKGEWSRPFLKRKWPEGDRMDSETGVFGALGV